MKESERWLAVGVGIVVVVGVGIVVVIGVGIVVDGGVVDVASIGRGEVDAEGGGGSGGGSEKRKETPSCYFYAANYSCIGSHLA